jgi:hypothetical protein
VEFIKIEEQLGDILTKPLSKIKFIDLCNKIGLKTHQKKATRLSGRIVRIRGCLFLAFHHFY